MKPTISVIVPSSAQRPQIEQCLKALSKQSLDTSKYEVIIVSNGKLNFDSKLIKRYQAFANFHFIHIQSRGLMYARHAGVIKARGEIIAFIDDDATADQNWLKELLSCYESPDDVMVGGRIDIKWDFNPPEWVKPYQWLLGELNISPTVKRGKDFYLNGSNLSIRKKVLLQVGGFNPDQIDNVVIGDGETGLRRKVLAEGYYLTWNPKAVVTHHQLLNINATEGDIRRRFANNKSSEIYGLLNEPNERKSRRWINLFINHCFSLINNLRYRRKLTKEKTHPDTFRYNSFNIYSDTHALQYLLRLIYDKELRIAVKRTIWIN